MLLFLNRQYECTSFNLVGLLSSVRTADGIFHLCGPTRFIRDLEIRGRDKLRRLPEVNFHNEACAHEAQTRVLAVLVSSTTRFSLHAVVSKTWVFLGLFLRTIRRNRFPLQICWPWCFLRSSSSRFLSEIFRNEEKGHNLCPLFVACVLQSRLWMFLSAQWRRVNHCKAILFFFFV